MGKRTFLLASVLMLNACSLIYEQDTRSTKIEWEDRQISMKIAGIVNRASFIDSIRVNAASYAGKVLLVGQAKTELLKQSLITKIRELDGIEIVYDQIRIKVPLSLYEVSKDTWLTAKVKSAIISSKRLRDVDIKVITEDREVFLLGYVSREQANDVVEITRNISGVKRVIKGFQYNEDKAEKTNKPHHVR
ncbi:BON domain-containing protein [Candidatus Enterovibrio escicola]|uniref:21 kDa hemolysin n=1 Tax=Candidatus Enterovibrio escicola TaxID=1927127 RepID=A0A2A5T599_9GAMM|nr:BON domain-containing protein [Candidatus Enterovibrio escacola]PCS23359.1 21 kDa hemolysin precursor [Candidatus Enterovibrio escacola]